MKKKAWMILIVSLVIIMAIGIICYKSIGRRPYKDLNAVDIVSASLELLPPDETVEIIEIKELVEYLKNVVIYEQDDSWREYAGQATVFTLTMADGTIEEITAYNPFVIINGIGYRTKYEPCEQLNNLANRLLNQKKTGLSGTEPSVVKTYEKTPSEHAFENGELCILAEHYEMSDGTWETDKHTYKYRLEITGRQPNAVKDSTYVYLSNIETITFRQAMMASGLSSNTSDYFDPEVATLVAMK